MMRVSIAALLLSTMLPIVAHGADQTVLGNQLNVKAGATPDKRKIIVKAKEKASDNVLVGDPLTGGATLTVSANGTTSTSQTFNLPVGTSTMTGKPFWSGSLAKGYKYKDPKRENGPVKIAQIKKTPGGVFQIKVVIDAKGGSVTVVPPNTGTFGCAQLTLGTGDSYHVRFASGVAVNKGASQFLVKKPTLQGTCTPCDFLDHERLPVSRSRATTSPSPIRPPTPAAACTSPTPACRGTTPASSVESSDYNWNDGFSLGATILTRVPNVDLGVTGAPPITDIAQSLDSGLARRGGQHRDPRPSPDLGGDRLERRPSPTQQAIDHPSRRQPRRGHALHRRAAQHEGLRRRAPPAESRTSSPIATTRRWPTPRRRRAGRTWRASSRPSPPPASRGTTSTSRGTSRSRARAARRERLLSIRDDAFARLDSASPAFVVSNVFEHSCSTTGTGSNPAGGCSVNADCGTGGVCNLASTGVTSNIFRRVAGTYAVERYVDSPTPPARFVLDANGLPVHQATPQPASFICNIPRAALPTAAGHCRAGARVDLRPRPPRLEHRGERRQRPGHGERAQLRLLRHEVDRHGRRGRRDRGRHPRRVLEVPEAHRPPAAVDGEPALPRPPDDPPERLRRQCGVPGRVRAIR